jgi:hypothetical protein
VSAGNAQLAVAGCRRLRRDEERKGGPRSRDGLPTEICLSTVLSNDSASLAGGMMMAPQRWFVEPSAVQPVRRQQRQRQSAAASSAPLGRTLTMLPPARRNALCTVTVCR